MKKRIKILCSVLLIVCVVIGVIVICKKAVISDYSEDSYLYNEMNLGNEENTNIENYLPIEK